MALNIITREINRITDIFPIRPQTTAGTAWSNGFVMPVTDVDLTPANGFASDEKAQYVGVGAELNAWNWPQLRSGYRADMPNNNRSIFTTGVGVHLSTSCISPWSAWLVQIEATALPRSFLSPSDYEQRGLRVQPAPQPENAKLKNVLPSHPLCWQPCSAAAAS